MGTPNCASPHDGLAPKMLSAIFRVYTFFLGFLYPAYASYKAIESEATDDDTQWLTYWVVYSMLMIFESFADYSVFWIPGYRFAKCDSSSGSRRPGSRARSCCTRRCSRT